MTERKERRRVGDPRWPRSDETIGEARPLRKAGGAGYRVRIVYTEPEFQDRNPQCPSEFTFSQDYPRASSPQEAVREAMDFFDFCSEHSQVGWRRILKSLTVERA